MASSGNNSATSYSSGPRFHERFAQPSFNSGFNVKLQKPKGLPKIVAPVPGASQKKLEELKKQQEDKKEEELQKIKDEDEDEEKEEEEKEDEEREEEEQKINDEVD